MGKVEAARSKRVARESSEHVYVAIDGPGCVGITDTVFRDIAVTQDDTRGGPHASLIHRLDLAGVGNDGVKIVPDVLSEPLHRIETAATGEVARAAILCAAATIAALQQSGEAINAKGGGR
jgi:hypothetical protein